jgi:DUF177 domain-containing protein
MLVFDLRTLAGTAATVDGVLDSDDPVWQPQDRKPESGVQVTGRLSAAGPGRFYFSGQIRGTFSDECRRCLTGVQAEVVERARWLFAEVGVEDAADDPDVYLFDARARDLDLRPAAREQWLLDVPAFVQCREECAGLCPSCGADLNNGLCGCPPAADERWAALRGHTTPGGSDGPA